MVFSLWLFPVFTFPLYSFGFSSMFFLSSFCIIILSFLLYSTPLWFWNHIFILSVPPRQAFPDWTFVSDCGFGFCPRWMHYFNPMIGQYLVVSLHPISLCAFCHLYCIYHWTYLTVILTSPCGSKTPFPSVSGTNHDNLSSLSLRVGGTDALNLFSSSLADETGDILCSIKQLIFCFPSTNFFQLWVKNKRPCFKVISLTSFRPQNIYSKHVYVGY